MSCFPHVIHTSSSSSSSSSSNSISSPSLPNKLFLVFALKLIPFSQHPWLSSESYASLVLNFCLSLMLSSCSSKISSSSLFHLVFSLESFLQSYSICSTVPNNLLESFHPIYTIPCRSVYIYIYIHTQKIFTRK